ncbi:MAG: hypothetical protein CMK32_09785 [Porticoccaceae bacterium]|nr:hypothetical protein [Porticoccaceae bacterium]
MPSDFDDPNRIAWVDSIVELAMSRAVYRDTNRRRPKLQVGDAATVVYNAIKERPPAIGRKSLMFLPQLHLQFKSMEETRLNTIVARLQEDFYIAPVHYHSNDGACHVGYRAISSSKTPRDGLADELMAALRDAGVGGLTLTRLSIIVKDHSESFSHALDRLICTGRVIHHMKDDGDTQWYTAAVHVRDHDDEELTDPGE